jgi:hypothetical protein
MVAKDRGGNRKEVAREKDELKKTEQNALRKHPPPPLQNRRKIRLIEGNVKICRHLKKLICKGTLQQVFTVRGPEPHTPPNMTDFISSL